jgi:hypothetical protein
MSTSSVAPVFALRLFSHSVCDMIICKGQELLTRKQYLAAEK